jgi:uncharacterized membrane protein YfhO
MKNIKKVFKRNKLELLSSAIVIFILCIVYVFNQIAPFGNQVSMVSDSYHQYIPLLSQLYDKISNGESLIYSLDTGLGTSAIGNIINYLLSPLTWLIIAFGKDNIPTMFGISIILKATISAFTCTFFLKKKTGDNNLSLSIFGVLYALSYYFAAYYWNVMWMDALYMLPLIAYGIYRLVKDKSFIPYVIALSYTIITNYYMGFMLCIASVIYFIYEYFTTHSIKEVINENEKNVFKKYKFLNTSVLFAISSVVAAGISCIALIPMYSALSTTSAVSNPLPTSIDFYPIISVISNHFYCNMTSFNTNLTNTGIVPNVYCGILTLACVPLFFLSKEVSKKEKIFGAGIIAFFFLSFCTNILNYIWHAGHFPNSLPYRFSYIYIFFLIYFAYIGFSKIEKISKRKVLISTGIWCVITALSCSISAPNGTAITLPFTIILFIIYGVILLIINKKQTTLKTIILMSIVVCELLVPYVNSMDSFDSKALYEQTSDAEYMKNAIDDKGDKFYRADLIAHTTSMPCVLYDYNGLSTFTSVSYGNIAKLQLQMGVNSNGLNSAYYQPQTPIYNMIMSVNYLMDNDSPYELSKNEFIPIGTNKDTKSVLYENKYKTSIAFGSKTDLSKTFDKTGISPFDVQNRFAQALTDTTISPLIPVKDTVFKGNGIDIEVKETEQGYTVSYKINPEAKDPNIQITTTTSTNNCHYLVVQDALDFKHSTDYNGKEILKALDIYPGSVCVGDVKSGETYTTTITPVESCPSEGEIYYYTCYYDTNATDQLYSQLQKNGIAKVTEFEDDYVKFEINNTTDYIFTSIPYDKNWKVKIDGKVISMEDIKQTSDALCLIEITPGKHIVEFAYKQSSILTGLIISSCSLLLFICMIILFKKNYICNSTNLEKTNTDEKILNSEVV